jgi:hypothetical protein
MTEEVRKFVDRDMRKIIWVQETGGLGDFSGPNLKLKLGT